MARTATSRARQLSKPPEIPMTAVFAWACSNRLARPSACIFKISSHRAARRCGSPGTKGVGSTKRVRAVLVSVRLKSTV